MNEPVKKNLTLTDLNEQIIELRRQNNLLRWSLKAIIKAHPPFATAIQQMLETNLADMLTSQVKDEEIERVQKFLDELRK